MPQFIFLQQYEHHPEVRWLAVCDNNAGGKCFFFCLFVFCCFFKRESCKGKVKKRDRVSSDVRAELQALLAGAVPPPPSTGSLTCSVSGLGRVPPSLDNLVPPGSPGSPMLVPGPVRTPALHSAGVPNPRAPTIRRPQPPKKLGLQARATEPGAGRLGAAGLEAAAGGPAVMRGGTRTPLFPTHYSLKIAGRVSRDAESKGRDMNTLLLSCCPGNLCINAVNLSEDER